MDQNDLLHHYVQYPSLKWYPYPLEGISKELDDFRKEIKQQYPTIQILDSPYYGVDTFALCEMNPYILITQKVYADIHPNLITIPLDTSYSMPYGLMYTNTPSSAVTEFIKAIQSKKFHFSLS